MPLDCCSQVHVIFNSFLASLSRVLLTNTIQRSKQFVQCCSASKKQLTVLLDAYKARHTYITLWLQACSVEIRQLSFSLYIQDFKFHTLHSNHNENTIIACKFLNGHNALLSYIYIFIISLAYIPFLQTTVVLYYMLLSQQRNFYMCWMSIKQSYIPTKYMQWHNNMAASTT